jgi:hypothetical protein
MYLGTGIVRAQEKFENRNGKKFVEDKLPAPVQRQPFQPHCPGGQHYWLCYAMKKDKKVTGSRLGMLHVELWLSLQMYKNGI